MNLLLGAFDAEIGFKGRFDGIPEFKGLFAVLCSAGRGQQQKNEKGGNPLEIDSFVMGGHESLSWNV
jgi:hypothetical protein